MESCNYLFKLPYLAKLKIIGNAAADFLQGQVSCDMRQVSANMMRQGALCNLQGRVLALIDFILWHDYHCILPNNLLPVIQESLLKVALLMRIKMTVDLNTVFCGFYLGDANDLLPLSLTLPPQKLGFAANDESCCYNLGNNFYIILIHRQAFTAFTKPFIERKQMRSVHDWHKLQLQQKHIAIYPETSGLFLPHRLNLHLAGYLSFDKGCYRGQEIIARTHYRAKLKYELQIFIIDTTEKIIAGKKIFDFITQREIGKLIDFCRLEFTKYLIVASMLLEHQAQVLVAGHQNPVMLISY